VLEPAGVTFTGHRAADEQASEFLASTDAWFRPVQVRTGPDGALWIVDMYRFVIEHPRWISPDRLATLDVRAGHDRGRIYRVYPEGQAPRPVPRLDALTTPELASALESPNGTLRDNVQRLLVHRADRAAVPVLRTIAAQSPRPESRAQALGALEGLGALDPSAVATALRDPSAAVRRQAVRLTEPWLGRDPALSRAVVALADDPEIRVRYQAALSLGQWDAPEAGRALGAIAARDGGDLWMRAAVLSSSAKHAATVLEAVIDGAKDRDSLPELVEPLIATISAVQDGPSITRALDAIRRGRADDAPAAPWQLGATAELLDAVRGGPVAEHPAVRRMIGEARALVREARTAPALRATAVRLLGRVASQVDDDRATLTALLEPSEPVEVELAAVRALARLGDRAASQALVARWARLGPVVRSAALDALLARPASTRALIDALERGRLAPAEIDATHRQALLTAGDARDRERAARVFGHLAIGPRQAVLDAYASARSATGDPDRGKAVFTRVCATCHRLGGVGHEIGPDLAALTDTTPDALMTAVLDPNREVDARYASYTAALKDGRVVTGLIASETASAITLKRQEGQADVILRADLEELTTGGKSLMPEGLENDLKPADLADLMAFVARGTDRPKTFAGNRPRPVEPSADGSIRLPASAAEIYGPSLVYESTNGNLGNWQSVDDHAVWTFRVEQPGTYTVSIEWACADESAGNTFEIRVGKNAIGGVVGGTGAGTWSNYRSIFVQEMVLTPGTRRLDFRPAGPVKGALLDLRSVTLTPRSESVFKKANR
jgi:putative heme-binding domain-containing protein